MKNVRIVVGVLTFLVAALMASCAMSRSVEYYVSGTAASVSITYQTSDGSVQTYGTALPWKDSFDTEKALDLSISAKNQGATGNLTVKINVDGGTVATDTDSNPYGIASASDHLGVYYYSWFRW